MKKLAIITTHPIQYNAPLFKLLTERNVIQIKVFYTWGDQVLKDKYDPGFGKVINWDIPLLKGYEFEFLENIATDKGSHHFKGIENPHLIESVKQFQPDALLVYGWSFKSHLKLLRYFKNRIPIFFRGDSTLLDEKGILNSIKRNLFLRWVYRHIDWALYVGKNNFDYFRKAGISKNQLIWAPHAIDILRFKCDSLECKQAAYDLRRQLQIEEKDIVFLFAGKLEDKKSPQLLLDAFVACKFERNVHLIMVGNGVLENELKSKYLNLQNIHFLDFQNQGKMPSIYESADVFVLPSKGPGETWGLAVNEAMANSKAIIVSDKCGCAVDLVKDGVNGYIFKSNDQQDLMQKLKLMVENGDLIKTMGEHSFSKIQNWNFVEVAIKVENLVCSLEKPNPS